MVSEQCVYFQGRGMLYVLCQRHRMKQRPPPWELNRSFEQNFNIHWKHCITRHFVNDWIVCWIYLTQLQCTAQICLCCRCIFFLFVFLIQFTEFVSSRIRVETFRNRLLFATRTRNIFPWMEMEIRQISMEKNGKK